MDFIYQNWKDIILFITFLALIQQLYHSRKSVDLSIEANKLSLESFRQDITIRQIEQLPKHGFIISSQVTLSAYISEINIIITILKDIVNDPINEQHLLSVSEHWRDTKRLVHKSDFKPQWLDVIDLSAAQYYYNLIGNLKSFRSQDKSFNEGFAKDLLQV